MVASYKFIQKFSTLHEKIKAIYIVEKNTKLGILDESLEEFTNQMISKVNINLEKFRYNVIIANLHEIYNFFIKRIQDKIYSRNMMSNYTKILTIMMPIIPHLASEFLSQIDSNKNWIWPEVDMKYLKTEKNLIVIQINGKKRGIIDSEKNIGEKDLIEKIKKKKELQKFFEDKKIFKSIFIRDKLINLIVK